jgi:hypothetical protein
MTVVGAFSAVVSANIGNVDKAAKQQTVSKEVIFMIVSK